MWERPSTTICSSNPGIVNPRGGGKNVPTSARGYIPVVEEDRRGVEERSTNGRASLAPRRADPQLEPAPTIALGHNEASWGWERPATTVMGDQRVFPPNGHHPAGEGDSWSSRSTRVTIAELGILQGFPADHPWQPPRRSAQIGNAIPPPLAEACLRALTG